MKYRPNIPFNMEYWLQDNMVVYGGFRSLGGGAGQYQAVQLWNPANSGRTVYLLRFLVASSQAGNLTQTHDTAALTNSAGALTNLHFGSSFTNGVQLRYDTQAAISGTTIGLFSNTPAASSYDVIEPFEVSLDPGHGLSVWSPVAGSLVATVRAAILY